MTIVLCLHTFLVNAQSNHLLMDDQNQNQEYIVFMGNSIIQGWKQADPEFFSNPRFLNRGIGGQTTPQMLERFQRDVLDIKPEAVLILAGTNDIAGNTGEISLQETRDNISSMTQMALDAGIRVILCSVLPAHDYPWRRGREPSIKIPELNRMIKALAEEKEAVYLDFFSVMADERNGLPVELALDGVHPTAKGYALMRDLTRQLFQEMKLIP